MSLVQVRQKRLEFPSRRNRSKRLCVNERRTKERREKRGREKGAEEEADDPEVVQPAEREKERDCSKTCSYYEHIKKPQGAICWLSFQTFFQPVYIGNKRQPSAVLSLSYPFLARFSCLFLSRATIFPSRFFSTSPFSFPRLIPSAFLPLPFASRSINARFLRWHD